ncbi:uncharacterized protein LOC130891737 isoform X1 [Diorhabda carinulata]|uniref:uncharacterized protein LOC130891737 isoform X1 n=1 Tax=Diorhabda carinulata TaxID=1163345 RepID=UPI0025A2214B|nr:uncharacterized protein LOC130891737 isoform X1 [Diorhabda carinulata]
MPVVTDVLDWKIFPVGIGFLILTLMINNVIPLLPVSGFAFLSFSLSFWFISLCITFFYLHKLLQRKVPLNLIKPIKHFKKHRGEIKPNPEKLQEFTEDIDKYFVSKWYVFISLDTKFTEETRFFIEDVIKRIAEVQSCVNNKALAHGVFNIYLKHLKEYRRSLKRKEKYNGSIEEMYRYSHIVSMNNKVKTYFIHQLTKNTMKHFINSELWNSLPCHVLVSIIARKLVLFILNFISQPEVLNYNLFNILATKEIKDEYNLSNYNRICINQYYNVVDSKTQHTDTKEIEIPREQKIKRTTTPTVQVEETIRIERKPNTNEQEIKKRKNSVSQYKKSKIVKKIDSAEEVKEEQQMKLTKSTVNAPVKIHEPKLTRSTKTYADTKDLAYGISLGQDPLDVLPVKIENVRSKIEHVEDSANLLLSEVKHTTQSTMEGLKSSIKPISDATVHTLHNIKDLQETTMNNALHRIGDFQDEAAGMVEGILDFGRAGLRKGLRLTGLQDNIEQAKASLNISQSNKQASKMRASKIAKTDSTEKSVVEEESVWMNPLQIDSPNYDGQILLEKSLENPDREKRDLDIPSISMEEPSSGTNTPDIEYEETADLASSIAKLRSLLQQRSSESSISTPALSPICVQSKYNGFKFWVADRLQFFQSRPPDDLTQKPLEGESTVESDEVDGMIPSFYKFCAKTATGVFDKTIHSIKTALPTHVPGLEHSDNAWIFLQTDQTEVDVLTRMKKLLNERKEYCTLDSEIDTAYEAIDSLDTFQQSLFSSSLEFEDELDEFEAKLPITKSLIDIACELLSDTDSPFITEPVIKAILLIAGNAIENSLVDKMDQLMEDLCTNLLTVPEVSNSNELNLEMDIFVQLILASIPDSVKVVFGKDVLQKVISLLVSSIQIQKINQDVILQIFELVSLKLIEESSRPSPPASA